MKLDVKGVTEFFSETGTEGGMWAVHDTRYITRERPSYGVFARTRVWDADAPEREGTVLEEGLRLRDGRPLPDPINSDPDYYQSSLFMGAERGDHAADARLAERYGFEVTYRVERPGYISGGTPDTVPRRPYGVGPDGNVCRVRWSDGAVEDRSSDTLLAERWSYEGLHVLADGDHLRVFEPDGTTVRWEGEVRMVEIDLFSEDAFGLWLRSGWQEGEDKETWARMFFEGLPAELSRG